jgi:hypothetical protein
MQRGRGVNMLFKTASECAQAAAVLDLGAQALARLPVSGDACPGAVRLVFTRQAAACRGLARAIVTSWLEGPFYLLWLQRWGVWPRSENMHLYYRLRQSYGEQRSLEDAPGHEFGAGELVDAMSFLEMALAYGWGGFFLGSRGALWFSPEGWLRVQNPRSRDDVLAWPQLECAT